MNEAQFAWLDLETTGLNPQKDHILEIAVVVTDAQLNQIDSFESVVANREYLSINPFVTKMHLNSGLFNSLQQAALNYQAISVDDIQNQLVSFLRKYPPLILAGLSVHFDKEFLRAHMPAVFGLFSHKLFDASTLKMAARAWGPDMPEYDFGGNQPAHRATADCLEAIEVARHYKRILFDPAQ